jgi:enamine deaminase RidA (YjgF/YER057c/UK114 family)
VLQIGDRSQKFVAFYAHINAIYLQVSPPLFPCRGAWRKVSADPGEAIDMKTTRVGTGNPWGDTIGYSRALRRGPFVFVSGTTATGADGRSLAPDDPAGQTRIILERIRTALEELGGSLHDVVDTKIYLCNIDHWSEVGRMHGEFFRDIRPASTMVVVNRLLTEEMLVEISVIALLEGDGSRPVSL